MDESQVKSLADKKLGRAAPDPATRALFDYRSMNLDEVAQQDREWLANLKDQQEECTCSALAGEQCHLDQGCRALKKMERSR